MSAKSPFPKTTLLESSPRKIILLHIAKTGGTSSANRLFDAFEPGEIINDFPGCRTMRWTNSVRQVHGKDN
jgi:hypothetical protein